MAKWIHNCSANAVEFQGRAIQAGQYYAIPVNLVGEFQTDESLLLALLNGVVKMSNDGATDINGGSDGIDFLKNADLTPKDSDGAPITRSKTTRTGWHFEPRSLDFTTSKFGSLYNRKHNGNGFMDGTDYNDAWMFFFDASGNALTKNGGESDAEFQARLTSSCVRTHVDWQSAVEMDVIGATVSVLNAPTGSDRGWCWIIVAPDIPANFGGSVPFMSGGWNMRFFASEGKTFLDGRGVKPFLPDPVNNSNKMRVVLKHEVGAQIECQFVVEKFNA